MPANWRAKLSALQYQILFAQATEPAGSSALNHEFRAGSYHCAACDQLLFASAMKYDSGSGWPSFFACIAGSLQTQVDHQLEQVRTEYHCSRCGGHQGHVFSDGPAPSKLRYCNNGAALRFKLASAPSAKS